MIPRLWHSHLLDRLSGTVTDVLDGALGIYGTQPTAHLAVLARLEGFGTAELQEVLGAGWAVRLRTLRGSGFLIPRHLLPVTQAATREANFRSALSPVRRALGDGAYQLWADRIDDLLAAGPMTAREIRRELEPGSAAPMIRYVIGAMATENRLVSVPVAGSWRSDAQAYARWGDRLPDVDVWSLDRDEATERLARLYLDRYGPATVEDLAWWSGLGRGGARAALAACGHPVGVDGVEMWSTGDRPDDPPFGVRLLGVWDPLLVGYRDRTRFVAESRLPYVYDASGNATSVILVDGSVAGVWDLGPEDDRLVIGVAGFEGFPASVLRGIRAEARRIGGLAMSGETVVIDRGRPRSLTDGPRGRFLRPLSG